MTQHLLDTDSFIFLLKQQPIITAKVGSVGYQALALSIITAAEVLHGAYFSANPTQSLKMTRDLLGRFTFIELTEPIADKFGELKATLRRQGQVIADFDLIIGATAIITGRTLVTNNSKHFQRLAAFGLIIENWTV